MEIKLPRCVSARDLFALFTILVLIFSFMSPVSAETVVADKAKQIELGKKLYFDVNLSKNKNQSCNTCHNAIPKKPLTVGSFVDDREPVKALLEAGWPEDVPPPVSQGSVLTLFGGRNTPLSAYAAFSPAFRFDEVEGLYIGGQFWDGREMSLAGQAAGPFRNPVEMAMYDKRAVVRALKRDWQYYKLFAAAYEDELGKPYRLAFVSTWLNQHVLETYDLMAKAIGEFEKTQLFNKFNSRYDYYLFEGRPLSIVEEEGRVLFENEVTGAKCSLCHLSQPSIAPDDSPMPPLFTDFTYDNLGIPQNPVINKLLGAIQPPDLGLGNIVGPSQDGKFKVMTLRNIELTAPYGHNGFFPTLESIVRFYNTAAVASCKITGVKPVTPKMLAEGMLPVVGGEYCWPDPEVGVNVNTEELGNLGLTTEQEAALVAFLKTLTDTNEDPVFLVNQFPPMP